jgi:drug/metabolite transporter (DMT)-like permease
MLKSTTVIFAAILSVFYLKNKLYRHHTAAIVMIIIGTGIVGTAMIIQGGKNNQSKSLFTGIILLLIG